MASTLDARPYAVAAKTAITMALQSTGETWAAFDRDEVPKPLPDIHVVIDLQRRFVDNQRGGGTNPTVGWRITCRGVGQAVDEVRWALLRTATALEEYRLALTGIGTTPLTLESEDPIDTDDGWYSGAATYTFVSFATT